MPSGGKTVNDVGDSQIRKRRTVTESFAKRICARRGFAHAVVVPVPSLQVFEFSCENNERTAHGQRCRRRRDEFAG